MSEGRHDKRMVIRELNQKQVPAFFLRNDLQCNQYVKYNTKNPKESNGSAMKLQAYSLSNVKSEASILPDPNIGLRKYSPIEGNSSLISLNRHSNPKETPGEYLQTFGGQGEMLPRKFSHITKLAQRLALHDQEDLPFNLAQRFETEDVEPQSSKLTTIKLKRNNSNKLYSNSFVQKSIVNEGGDSERIYK